MTGLFLVFLSVLAGVMGGIALSNKTRMRETYFEEVLKLIDRLISDISFLQCTTEQILLSCQFKSTQLNKNISEYLGFISGADFNLSTGLLNKRESSIVKDFFYRLGTLDLSTQIGELESKKEVFKQIYNSAVQKNKSYGKAYIKLGFLAGLLVGVLLL